jgi:hypothetical protein
MNERIRDLALQADLKMCGCGCDMPTRQIAKYAELIVRECGAVAYKAYWKNPETVRGRHIEEQIREHFGVK